MTYEYDVEFDEGGFSAHNGSDWRFGQASSAGGGGAIHDATLDWDGNFWFTSNRSSNIRTVARVDGKTGKTTNFGVPIGDGKMAQSHGILLGPDGRVYFNASPKIAYLDGDLGIIDTRDAKGRDRQPARRHDQGQRLAGVRRQGQHLDGERPDERAGRRAAVRSEDQDLHAVHLADRER